MCRQQLSLIWLGVLCVAACGCTVHKVAQTVTPTVPAYPAYAHAPERVPAAEASTAPWWTEFHDPVLDSLVGEALRDNLELQQLTARIEQASALLRQSGARLFPLLTGSAGYDATWTDLEDSSATVREDSASVGALLSWEVDVWGRLRSAKRATEREVDVAVYDWLGGRLMLSASVGETYFEIMEQREQLRLLQEQIRVNQTLLELTQLRFGQGLSSIVDVLQQREQLASTQARLPEVEAREGQLRQILNVLLGRAPEAPVTFQDWRLADPPPLPPSGVPSDLLANRPDLQAAHEGVVALDYRVGEAIADRLPRFVIGGSLSAVGEGGLGSLLGTAFASAVGPLFDAGERRAVEELRRAQLKGAVAAFSNEYLVAVREVETALLVGRKQAERVDLLVAQLRIAQRLMSETRNRYSQGLTDYLPVLAAVSTEQTLQRELITSRRQSLSYRVALHRALGGPMGPPRQFDTASVSHE
jgi:NodT family efflux transporter outer membrane factor (OMF) lipoprotein